MLAGADAGYSPPVVSLRLLRPYYSMYVIPIQCPFGKLCRQERGWQPLRQVAKRTFAKLAAYVR
jgi:hypothetical protein